MKVVFETDRKKGLIFEQSGLSSDVQTTIKDDDWTAGSWLGHRSGILDTLG